jgi:HAD superfamily hydrolase (TIGR01549 family)
MKAFIFDLDGTLVDTVYAHTLAWQKSLAGFGMACAAWSVHRRIGMSGKLLVKAIAREQGRTLSAPEIAKICDHHAQWFRELSPTGTPLPGAAELLAHLAATEIPHGIATSGKPSEIESSLTGLGLSSSAIVVTGDMVREVKPEPDLFLLCQQKLKVERHDCLIVGDAVWDIYAARRSGILSVGFLSGGSGEQALYNAGAMRVFRDAKALHESIDELGFD